jgi:hypothetical protein
MFTSIKKNRDLQETLSSIKENIPLFVLGTILTGGTGLIGVGSLLLYLAVNNKPSDDYDPIPDDG